MTLNLSALQSRVLNTLGLLQAAITRYMRHFGEVVNVRWPWWWLWPFKLKIADELTQLNSQELW